MKISKTGEMGWLLRDGRPTKEMKEYALEEMIRLVKNMQYRPVQCYLQKVKGGEKEYYLGAQYCDKLIEGLKQQYK